MCSQIIIPPVPCWLSSFNVISGNGHDSINAPESPIMAEEPDYKPVIEEANLRRRMGRLLKMAVCCGLKSMDGTDSSDVAGIITFTGMGFMKDTISFADNMLNMPDLLNPSPFMQSTFNTASGYIALIRKIRAYNMTYVQRGAGLSAALTDASMLLCEDPSKSVLVGSFDEVTETVDRLRLDLGIYESMPLGEGASTFVVSGTRPETTSYRLLGIAPSSVPVNDFVNACAASEVVNVLCSSHIHEVGAFMTMLPVVMSRFLIANAALHSGTCVLVKDDVNADGQMILLRAEAN